MAKDTEQLVLQLSADMKQFERAMVAAAGSADRAAARVERRWAQQNANVLRGFQNFQSQATNIIASIGVGVVVRDVVQLGDKWTRVGNSLATAGVEAQQLAGVQDVIADIAIRTNTELESTANLFSRLYRASGDLGANMGDVLAATELVNKALSGASQSERASTVTQFGQGLSSGRFQGDELRSVLENSRPIAEAIAREFDTTIGNLRELGKQGQLAADRVLRAVLNAAPEIEAAFARTNTTVEDSFTRLQTQMARYVGTNEKTSGATRTLAQLIQFVAGNFEAFADAAVLAATVLGGSFAGLAVGQALTALGRLQFTAAAAGAALKAAFSISSVLTVFGGAVAYAATQTNLFANSAEAAARHSDLMYRALNVLANLEPITAEDVATTEDQGEALRGVAGATSDVATLSERAAKAIDDLTVSSGETHENLSTQERLTRALARSQVEQAEATLRQARAAAVAREDTIRRDSFLRSFGSGTSIRPLAPGQESIFALTPDDQRAVDDARAAIRDYDVGLQALAESRARLREGFNPDGGGGGDDPALVAARRTTEELERQAQLNLARLRHQEAIVRQIEDAEAIQKRTAEYEGTGLARAAARARAESEVTAEREAMNAESLRSYELSVQQDQIDLARIQNNIALADVLSDQLEIQRRSRELVDQRALSEEQATTLARQYVEARREAQNIEREHNLETRDLELQLEAARLRGDEVAERAIRRRLELEERIADLRRMGLTEEAATDRAQNEVAALEQADLQGKFREWFTGGVMAAAEGDLGEFFENWLRDRARAGLESALNDLADVLFNLFRDTLSGVIQSGQEGLGQAVAAVFTGGAAGGLDKLGKGAVDAADALGNVLAASAADAATKMALSGAVAADKAAKEGALSASMTLEAMALKNLTFWTHQAAIAMKTAAASGAGGKGKGGGLLDLLISAGSAALGGGGGPKFGGFKAAGGPMNAGMAYMVGERGPEMVVPNTPSFVIPNGAFAQKTVAPQFIDRRTINITGASSAEVAQLRGILDADMRSRRAQTLSMMRDFVSRPRMVR